MSKKRHNNQKFGIIGLEPQTSGKIAPQKGRRSPPQPSPGDGDRGLLLSTHGDPALQVVELPEIFPQRAAALEVPGDVDGVLEGRKKKGEKKQEAENIGAVQGASCHPAPVGKRGRFGAEPIPGGSRGLTWRSTSSLRSSSL